MPMPYSVKLLKRLLPIRNSRINKIHAGEIRYRDKKKADKGPVEMNRPSITRKSVGSGLGLLVRHLGAVCCAAALALAGVLAFAAVVAGLATALTLAGVLAFTGVLFFHLFAGGLVGTVILSGHSRLDAWMLALVPASKPATAAPVMRNLLDLVIC